MRNSTGWGFFRQKKEIYYEMFITYSYINFCPEAEEDINDAFLWYESHSIGLGTEFIRSIDASFSSIIRNPELNAKIHHTTLRALARRFPYGVFYIFDDNKIIILAVMRVFYCRDFMIGNSHLRVIRPSVFMERSP